MAHQAWKTVTSLQIIFCARILHDPRHDGPGELGTQGKESPRGPAETFRIFAEQAHRMYRSRQSQEPSNKYGMPISEEGRDPTSVVPPSSDANSFHLGVIE